MSDSATTRKVLVSPIGRVSFHSLYEPTAMEEGQSKKYGVTLIFQKSAANDPAFRAMVEAANAACQEQFKCDLKGGRGKKIKSPFRDGAEKSHLDGYGDDVIFVRFSGQHKPAVVGPNKQPIAADASPEQGRVYNGCYGRVSFNVFTYSKVNVGVGLGLLNFQKTGDGDMFGFSGTNPDEDFDAVETSFTDDNNVNDLF